VNFDKDLHDADPQEREISLGTATILGIFLALALVCAAFFGFGYSLGRHSSQPIAVSAPETRTDSPFSKFKSQPNEADDAQTDTPTPNSASVEKAPEEEEKAPERVVVPQATPKAPSAARNVAFPVPAQPTVSAQSLPPTGAGQVIVQVSATSRQGDAESLIAALRQKGYTAAIRQGPQDKLFHVQIGPFATKKEADAMRQRLDTDGYKAIVK
jgi:DedD protein